MDMGHAPSITDQQWIAGLRADQDDTIAALRDRLRAGLGAALASREDMNDADLDDFTQDAVLRVLDRLDTYRGDSRFVTWAMAVAVRVSLTALRRRRWTSKPLEDLLHELASPSSDNDVAASSDEKARLFAALRSAIAGQLTPRQRQVVLGELEGIPQVVLADRLSATPGAIYKVSHDARKKLKAALDRAGYDAETVSDALADVR